MLRCRPESTPLFAPQPARRYHESMTNPGPRDDQETPRKERPFHSVIQIANNLFFIIVLIAIALGALAFGLTR